MSSVLKTTHSDSTTATKMLVGFSGLGRSGKDTAGAYLIAKGYRHGSFAIHLKRALAAMFGMSLEEVEYWKQNDDANVPGFNMTMRVMQQTLGTEWGRDIIDPDCWVKLTEREFDTANTPMVITDVRFENEAKWIRSRGGLVCHLRREDRTAINNASHVSEAGINIPHGDDAVIDNNGTLDDLYASIEALREHYDWLVNE